MRDLCNGRPTRASVSAPEEVIVVQVVIQEVQLPALLEPRLLFGQHLEISVVEFIGETGAPRHPELRLVVPVIRAHRAHTRTHSLDLRRLN